MPVTINSAKRSAAVGENVTFINYSKQKVSGIVTQSFNNGYVNLTDDKGRLHTLVPPAGSGLGADTVGTYK